MPLDPDALYSMPFDEEEARHLAQSILKRRATATRRIGVVYRIRELIDPDGWAGSYGTVGAGGRGLTRKVTQVSIVSL